MYPSMVKLEGGDRNHVIKFNITNSGITWNFVPNMKQCDLSNITDILSKNV